MRQSQESGAQVGGGAGESGPVRGQLCTACTGRGVSAALVSTAC